ncbi:Uncharacterised protein [Yersinia enterocolitica]|nr:Uncharacterised protein [Yersinia enterocolitica]
MFGIQRVLNTAAVIKQFEFRLIRCNRVTQFNTIRHVKTDATTEQRRQRCHFDSHALRREINSNATVFPEADVSRDQTVIRCANE